MSKDRPEDDLLHPSRWKSNWHSDPDGPISGDDYAYLKDLIHSQMGLETERFSAVKPAEPPAAPGRWVRLMAWLGLWRAG